MSRIQPLFTPLRSLTPLLAPRRAPCAQLSRFSTAPIRRTEQANASEIPAASTSPAARAASPTTTKPTASKKPPTLSIELPPPRYHVARSKSKNLPVYHDYKRGGNLHLTTVRKITGDLSALRDELRVFLNKKDEDVKINSLTQHVVVKGHHMREVSDFLNARGM